MKGAIAGAQFRDNTVGSTPLSQTDSKTRNGGPPGNGGVQVKRLFFVVVLALAVASASPAFADPPSTNKNTSVLTFNCTRGTETTSFQAVGIAQSQQVAGQLLEGSSVVVIVQIASNGQVVFEVPGQLGRADLWTCTIAELPGVTSLVFLTPRH